MYFSISFICILKYFTTHNELFYSLSVKNREILQEFALGNHIKTNGIRKNLATTYRYSKCLSSWFDRFYRKSPESLSYPGTKCQWKQDNLRLNGFLLQPILFVVISPHITMSTYWYSKCLSFSLIGDKLYRKVPKVSYGLVQNVNGYLYLRFRNVRWEIPILVNHMWYT